MTATTAGRWRWQLARAADGAGLPGAAAVALLLAGVVAGVALALPLADRTQSLAAGNALLERRLAAARQAAPRAPALSTARQLDAFERGLADERALAPAYARLWKIAQAHGLALRQAEFKLSEPGRDADAGSSPRTGADADAVGRYAITLPVTTDYRRLRAFIAQALRELPSLALEDVALRRDDAKATQLEARLRFVLFVGRRG